MSFGLSSSLRTARLTLVRTALDLSTSAGGQILFYSGTKPSVGAAITGQVLQATMTLVHPCGSIASNTLTFDVPDDAIRVAADPITWARFKDGDGNFVMDAVVSVASGGGDLQLSSVTGAIGGFIRLTSGSLSE